jgi:Phage integrase family
VVVDHQVHDSAPKTERGRRRLALDPLTLQALRDHRERQAENRQAVGRGYRDHGYVFTWPDGRPLHPDNIADWFEQHTRMAGLPRIRLHDVRHSYATAALKAGISARVISERLGHASVAFTLQTYGHVIPGMDKDAAVTVADLILGGMQKGPGTVVPDPPANCAWAPAAPGPTRSPCRCRPSGARQAGDHGLNGGVGHPESEVSAPPVPSYRLVEATHGQSLCQAQGDWVVGAEHTRAALSDVLAQVAGLFRLAQVSQGKGQAGCRVQRGQVVGAEHAGAAFQCVLAQGAGLLRLAQQGQGPT